MKHTTTVILIVFLMLSGLANMVGPVDNAVKEQNYDVVAEKSASSVTRPMPNSPTTTTTNRGVLPTGAHAPIRINNNTHFHTVAGIEGWLGIGTLISPYIIEDLIINAQGQGNAIYIGNVSTVYFIIRNCTLFNASGSTLPWGYGAGITLANVPTFPGPIGVVQANNCSNNKIGICFYGTNYCVIDNNNCSNNSQMGIYVDNSDDNIIKNNICVANNQSGIFLTSGRYNKFENNTCNSNTKNGISLYVSAINNKINNNTCKSNDVDGINLESTCKDNYLFNNTCTLNVGDGISLLDLSDDNLLDHNNCSNNFNGIFIQSTNNMIKNSTCTSNEFGISIFTSVNKIYDNTCKNNSESGIYLYFSNSNILKNNQCTSLNNKGILFYDSDGNSVFGNNFSFSSAHGLYLEKNSDGNYFSENQISHNSANGIFIDTNCINNRIIYNNFIDNTNQADDAFPTSTNWDNGKGEGNYWSDYTGLDNGADDRTAGDGIGDTNIPHPGSGYDNYPFMNRSGWLTLNPPTLNDPGVLDTDGYFIVNWSKIKRSTKYQLQEDESNLFSFPTDVFNTSATGIHIPRKGNGTYYYRLKMFNPYTESGWSNVVDIVVDWSPSAPTGLEITANTGRTIGLSWNPNPEPDIDGYHILMNDTGAGLYGPYHKVATVPHTTTSYTVTDLMEEVRYYFVITAYDNLLTNSTQSDFVSDTTPDVTAPAAPKNLSATALPSGGIELTWDGNTEPDLEGYYIYLSDPNVDAPGEFHYWGSGSSDMAYHTFDNLRGDATYHFKLIAHDEVPNNSSDSEIASATTFDDTPPWNPTNLTITDITNNSMKLSWTASVSPDVVAYNVTRGYFDYYSASFYPVNSEPVTDTWYIDTGLEEGTDYYYNVRSIDDAGWESEYVVFAHAKTILSPKKPQILQHPFDFKIIEDTNDDRTINLFNWFTDANDDPLKLRCTGQKHIHVTITKDTGYVLFVPDSDWNGNETLTFYASDGKHEISDNVTITVTPVNDRPADPEILQPQNGITIEKGDTIDLKGNCTDPDLPYGDKLTFEWSSDIVDDELGVGENLLDVTLPAGKHLITLSVSDESGLSSSASITIEVTGDISGSGGGDADDNTAMIATASGVVIAIVVILIILLMLIHGKKLPFMTGPEAEPGAHQEPSRSISMPQTQEQVPNQRPDQPPPRQGPTPSVRTGLPEQQMTPKTLTLPVTSTTTTNIPSEKEGTQQMQPPTSVKPMLQAVSEVQGQTQDRDNQVADGTKGINREQ